MRDCIKSRVAIRYSGYGCVYYWRREGRIQRRENRLLLCEGNAHQFCHDYATGELYCRNCGAVLNELRVDFKVLALLPARKRVVQSSFRRHRQRLQKLELKPIGDILGQSQVPSSTRRKAFEIYESFHKHQKGKNHPRETVGKASLYTASRLCGTPRPVRDFAETPKERTRTLRCHKRICMVLGLSMPRYKPAEHLQLIAAKKKTGKDVMQSAMHLVNRAQSERIIRGSSPAGIAAAAFYLACKSRNVKTTQKEIASIAGVSEITVRAGCRILKKRSDRKKR